MKKETMKAAVLHKTDGDFQVETVEIPALRPDEVLVKVEASNVVQNLANVLKTAGQSNGALPFPKLPAIMGLDIAGTVESSAPLANGIPKGQRVYVNPGLTCGNCKACRTGRAIDCNAYALRAYFGIAENSQKSLDDHPGGGFAEFIAVPQSSLVMIPDNVSFETASRFGYLGTAYRALKLAECAPGKVVLINGITGTLGLGAVAIALALGAKKVLGIARDKALFAKTQALGGPDQVEILESGSQPVGEWAMEVTAGAGVDIVIDAIGGGAPAKPFQEALYSLNRGGCLVNIGANDTEIPVNFFWAMSNNIQIKGSSWFTTGDCQEMADLAGLGALDLSYLEHEEFSLEALNDAVESTTKRSGGFSNFFINPNLKST